MEISPLTSLLTSCSNIRKRARSWTTLQQQQQPTNNGSTNTVCNGNGAKNDTETMQQEQRHRAEILDHQIWEYQSAIQRIMKRRQRLLPVQCSDNIPSVSKDSTMIQTQQTETETAAVTTSSSATKKLLQEHRLLQSKVMDKTLQRQQEHLLLSRIAMSVPAVWVAQQKAITTDRELQQQTRNITQQPQQQEEQQHRIVLLQEAMRARNRFVQKVLVVQQKLREVNQELRQVDMKCQQLRQQNRDTWNALQQKQQEEQEGRVAAAATNATATATADDATTINNKSSKTTTSSINTEEGNNTDRLVKETLVLKRVLADILAQQNMVDWYHDERLLETIQKLE